MLDTPSPLALIVDHQKSTHDRYAEWFAFSGFRIETASTVEEAVDKTVTLQPHIVATAIHLGLDDGCDLCQRLKADARTRTIPVIALSAHAMSAQLARARQAGCDSVLVKPCRPADLLREIRRLLKLADPIDGGSATGAEAAGWPMADQHAAWALATADGEIVQASEALGPILNVGARSLVGRNIYLFFEGQRLRLRAAVDRTTEEFGTEQHVVLRPRERRPRHVRVRVERRDDPGLFFWLIVSKDD